MIPQIKTKIFLPKKEVLVVLEEWTPWHSFHYQQCSGWHKKWKDKWETEVTQKKNKSRKTCKEWKGTQQAGTEKARLTERQLTKCWRSNSKEKMKKKKITNPPPNKYWNEIMARHLKFPIVSMQNCVFLTPFESSGLSMPKCALVWTNVWRN